MSPPIATSVFYEYLPPAILTLAAMTGLASATVVNIDFGNSATLNVYSGQAAAPDLAGGATATWNPLLNVAGTASSVALKDSTNTTTGNGFSLSGISGSTSNALTEGERSGGFVSLMRDYVQVDAANSTTIATATGSFTGLVVGATCDIYFYGEGEDMSTTTGSGGFRGLNSYFEVNGVGKQTSWDGLAGGDGLLFEGIEYTNAQEWLKQAFNNSGKSQACMVQIERPQTVVGTPRPTRYVPPSATCKFGRYM